MQSLPVNFTISTPSCVLVSISKVPSLRPLAAQGHWAHSLTPLNPFVRVRAHVRESSLKKQGTRPAGSSQGLRDGEPKVVEPGVEIHSGSVCAILRSALRAGGAATSAGACAIRC